VDFLEPVVEPNPGATGNTQSDVNALTVDVMNSVLLEDPDMIFILGGFSYQHGKIQDPIDGRTYPTTNIVLTCDLLDNTMSVPATLTTAVNNMVLGRNKQGYPVICQQAGTLFSSEVAPVGGPSDSLLLAAGLEALRTASGGSIGWTLWERVSKGVNQYGPWWDDSGVGTNRHLGSQNRLNVISAAFTAAPIYP